MTAKTFFELQKDLTADSAHVETAIGNEEDHKNAPKTDFEVPFVVAKADPDQQMIFGWASVIEKDGKAIIDKQGDIIPADELEKAVYDFVLTAREHDFMHISGPTGHCIESMVFTKAKQEALGINLNQVGWWVGFKVENPDVWKAIKAGALPEFSIGGSGVRVPTS